MKNSNRHISLRRLGVFCTVAERGSFRDAAEALFITASAVSHQIKTLEDELGQRLFDRNTTRLKLTGVGKALYDDLSPVLKEANEVVSRYAVKPTSRSTLRISVQPFFANELFVPRLPEFTARHPDIDITIDTSDESAEKHPAHADVSIRLFKSAPANLNAHALFPLRLVPAGSPDYRARLRVRARKIVSPFPLLVHEGRPQAWRDWSKSARIELPKDAKSVRLDSMNAIAKAAERGLGAALFPVQLGASWFDADRLVPLFDHELTTKDTYYLTRSAQSENESNVSLLRDWVLQNLADAN